MRHRNAIPLCALSFVVACGTGQTSSVIESAAGPPPAVVGQGSGMDIRYDRDGGAIDGVVEAPAARVWDMLAVAWTDLQIPVGSVDARSHSLTSGVFKPPSRMAAKRLNEYLDCGYSLAGPRVSLWEVRMEVVSAIRAEEGGRTTVATAITANARPRDGSNTASVPCNSLGNLERLVIAQVRERTRS
jgi:hypothetical protein